MLRQICSEHGERLPYLPPAKYPPVESPIDASARSSRSAMLVYSFEYILQLFPIS